VSPPSCHPDEGPPLLFSQSIEDLAAVIVKEKRQKDKKEPVEDVEKKPVVPSQTSPPPKTVPALIPLTVSEFGERPSLKPSSVLHMSGGGVYTTDSYFTKSLQDTARSKPGQTSVIKKLPLPTVTATQAKNTAVIKTITSPSEEAKKPENILWQYYKKSCLITEAQKTIKLSDGLEITPILTVPSPHPAQSTQKRTRESTEIGCNEGSKKARSDLVIEKIPRKNTKEEQSKQRDLAANEQTFDCKLFISKIDKKAKLVFENGTEVPISKNIFKHVLPLSRPHHQNKRMRRKTVSRKTSNGKTDPNNKDTKLAEDVKSLGNPDPAVSADMPVILDKDSTKTENPPGDSHKDSKPAGVGQHKLPSIVSQPSFHSGANRKIVVKSK